MLHQPQILSRSENRNTTGTADSKVLFVDDNEMIRKSLLQLISSQPGIQVISEASNGREAMLL
jgi:PleD family two-component response regulator